MGQGKGLIWEPSSFICEADTAGKGVVGAIPACFETDKLCGVVGWIWDAFAATGVTDPV